MSYANDYSHRMHEVVSVPNGPEPFLDVVVAHNDPEATLGQRGDIDQFNAVSATVTLTDGRTLVIWPDGKVEAYSDDLNACETHYL